MPARRPLKSLKTSSTVRGLYGAPPSMWSSNWRYKPRKSVPANGGKDGKVFDLWVEKERERESVGLSGSESDKIEYLNRIS